MKLVWGNPHFIDTWYLIDKDCDISDLSICIKRLRRNKNLIAYYMRSYVGQGYLYIFNMPNPILSKVIMDMVYKYDFGKVIESFMKMGREWRCRDGLWGGMIL